MNSTQTEISTSPYRLTASAYTSRMMRLWLVAYGWIFIIPLLVFCIMAFWRWEWLIAGLALIFLLYPMALTFVVFNYNLSPESRKEMYARRLTFLTDCMKQELNDCISDDDAEEAVFTPTETEIIPYDDIREISERDKGWLIRLRKDRFTHIFMPYSVLGDNERIVLTERLRKYGIQFA